MNNVRLNLSPTFINYRDVVLSDLSLIDNAILIRSGPEELAVKAVACRVHPHRTDADWHTGGNNNGTLLDCQSLVGHVHKKR